MTTTPAAVEALKLAEEAKVWIAQVAIAGHRHSPAQIKVAVEAMEAFIDRLAALAHQSPPTGVSGSQAKSEAVAWQVKQKTYKDRGPWVDVDRATYEAAAQYPHRCEVRALVPQEAVERQPLTPEQIKRELDAAKVPDSENDAYDFQVWRAAERHFGIGLATQEKQHG